MTTTELTLNGREWRLRKLDALTQLAIGVKLLPVIPSLRPVLAASAELRARLAAADEAIAEGREPEKLPDDAGVSDEALMRLGAALQVLGDDGRNYIVGACLGAVMMQVGGGFLPAWSARDQAPDPSIDLVTMMRLVYAVVMDNITGFSTALSAK